jgi:predicted metal-dependent enzyme (double-stranded beta helix superfamily)
MIGMPRPAQLAPSTPEGTMTLSAPLQDFLSSVDSLVARDLPAPALLDHLAPEFRRLLALPNLLLPDERISPTGTCQRVLYRDPAGRFSLVVLTWRPYAMTPIHDHHAWGLAGVYRGCERETRFAWCDRPGTALGLRIDGIRDVAPGEVNAIVPPSDIHRVLNPGPLPTVSLHLYGMDVTLMPHGSSVRRTYPTDLVVAERAEPASHNR